MAETITTKFLSKFFGQNDSLTIFDIGACDGEDSVRYASLFPNSKVYAFEPVLENTSKINERVDRSDVPNIKVEDVALSNVEGTCEMYISSGRPKDAPPEIEYGNKSSSILKPGQATKEVLPWLEFKEKREIRCTTLRNFCEINHISTIDFIHMDVQGAELLVLQGAGDKMSKIKSIWLEVSNVAFYEDQPLAQEITRFMESKGFRLVFDSSLYRRYGDRLYTNSRYFPTHKVIMFRTQQLVRKYLSKEGSRILKVFLSRIKQKILKSVK